VCLLVFGWALCLRCHFLSAKCVHMSLCLFEWGDYIGVDMNTGSVRCTSYRVCRCGHARMCEAVCVFLVPIQCVSVCAYVLHVCVCTVVFIIVCVRVCPCALMFHMCVNCGIHHCMCVCVCVCVCVRVLWYSSLCVCVCE